MVLATAGFALGIRPVSSLLPHEETIPAHVRQLASDIKRDGVQKDPIIIDKDSGTVLDGMHRLAAFGELGVENAVVCSVDYSSRAVGLRRWARVYRLSAGDSPAGAIAAFGNLKKSTLAEAFSELERKDAGFAILTSGAAYLSRGGLNVGDAMGAVVAFDRLSEDRRWERRFVPEDEVDVPLQDAGNIVLLVRRLAKDDVVAAAKTGRLFPCKTSMHVIDPRPVAVDFPIRELDSATTAILRERLGKHGGRLEPPGTVYEGRMYKERLLLLDQD
ncbi:MAG: ParB N-terminal domain-containing protein [Thaumarchaeota archaeon]|nr:ParB N-terminal domain-containing protein [Nitrososphaerota archaeon]